MTISKLIEAIEAGTLDVSDLVAFEPEEHAAAWNAYEGSLDAAKALHDALLPGWSWRKPAVPWEPESAAVQSPNWQPADDEDDEGGYPFFKGNSNDPARAGLLAILRALEATQEPTP